MYFCLCVRVCVVVCLNFSDKQQLSVYLFPLSPSLSLENIIEASHLWCSVIGNLKVPKLLFNVPYFFFFF